MIYKSNRNIDANIFLEKNLTKKKLRTFGWPKIGHIFINPYHNHFQWISKFKKTCMLMKNLKLFLFIHDF
jgi:hypothetical protein